MKFEPRAGLSRIADLVPAFEPADGPPPHDFSAYLRWSLRGAWKIILWAAVIGLFVGITESLGALLIGWTVDYALNFGPDGFFAGNGPLLLGLGAFFLLLRPILMSAAAALNSLGVGPNTYTLSLLRLNRHTLGQSIRFFDDDFAGRLSQKQLQTARATTDIINETVNAATMAVATVVGAVVIMGQVNSRLGAILLLWLIFYAVLLRYFIPRVRARAKLRAAARAALSGRIVDTFTNVATVKLFAHVGREEKATETATAKYRTRAIEFGVEAVLFRAALMFLAGALPVAMIGTALWLWQSGLASAGEIATAALISTRIAQMSGWVSFVAMGVFADIGEIEDGLRTLSPAHELVDRPGAVEIGKAKGAVGFERVGFQYGRADGKGGLEDFTLDIAAGEKVAFVGRSGAGKSTALSLLLRLYDVEAGRITLDGHDIRDLTQDSLRRQIAMVRQETAMFNRSAFENIAYGRPEASAEEIYEAARRAEAHEFIQDIRDRDGRAGYDAYLGERGVKLSGGQRQRIALARAILKDAPILALDEATAALDSETEEAVQIALERLMEGRTVIAIAHRLSTIARMDRIVVLEHGRIAEQGSHDALLEQGGLYAGFWSRQSGGFIDTDRAAEAAE